MADMTLAAAMAEIKTNPKKVYVYILSRPGGIPFYVGVGSGTRIKQHELLARRGVRGRKASIIRKIIARAEFVGYAIIQWFDDWSDALDEECRLIKQIGRLDLGAGTLANLTDGGEGSYGAMVSQETRDRISSANKGRKWNAESRSAFSIKCMGRKLSAETIEKTRRANTGKKRPAAAIELTRQKHIGSKRSPEFSARMSAARKGRKPPTTRQCEIFGISYPTLSAAALALSTRPSTVFHWIRRGVNGARYTGPRMKQESGCEHNCRQF